MKSMLVFMAFFALASASAVKFERPEDVNEESGKLFFTSNNMGSFLAINSTVLVVGVVALLLVAVVAVLLLGGGGLSSGYSRYGNEYPHAHHEQAYYGDETEYQTRYRRSAFNGNVKFSIIYR